MPQWTEFAADVPRFLANGWLLSAGQRTNGNPNPRCEGAAAPSTLPTGWDVAQSGGLTTDVGAPVVVNGVEGVYFRIYGTASATQFSVNFNALTAIAAAQNQLWTSSFFAQLVAAPLPPNGFTHRVVARVAGGNPIGGATFTTAFTPTFSFARYAQLETMPNDPTVAFVSHGFRTTLTNGSDYDFTIFIGWPQMEQAGFASTPILPPVGTPGASTRGADAITRAMSALFPGGSGTVIGTMAYDNLPGTGNTADFIQTDSGSNNDRLLLRILPTSNILRMVAVTGGTTTTADAGAPTLGAAFKWGLTWNGLGRAAACFNGASPVSLTGISAGHSNFRMLAGISLAGATFGRFGRILAMPFTIDDATLQARVAALPLT